MLYYSNYRETDECVKFLMMSYDYEMIIHKIIKVKI